MKIYKISVTDGRNEGVVEFKADSAKKVITDTGTMYVLENSESGAVLEVSMRNIVYALSKPVGKE
jgi:hypothetical protein